MRPAACQPACLPSALPLTDTALRKSFAACSAEPGQLYLTTAWSSIPHPEKVATGGEDALFAASYAVGIADGVGGWASQGIDAGEISRAVMSAADALATASPREHTALELLRNAWTRVAAQPIKGSTTAVLAALRGSVLSTANLGDSGFVIYRDGHALHRSVKYTKRSPPQLVSQGCC